MSFFTPVDNTKWCPVYQLKQAYMYGVRRRALKYAKRHSASKTWQLDITSYNELNDNFAANGLIPVIFETKSGYPSLAVAKNKPNINGDIVALPYDEPVKGWDSFIVASNKILLKKNNATKEFSDIQLLTRLFFENNYKNIRKNVSIACFSAPKRFDSLQIGPPPDKSLLAHQEQGVSFLIANKQALLGDAPGLGKTVQAMVALREIAKRENRFLDVLIIATKTGKSVWEAHKSWLGDAIPNINIRIIGYSFLKLARTKNFKPYDIVIIDEAHHAINPDTNTFVMLGKLLSVANPDYLWLLTGTPLSQPSKVYAYLYLLNALLPGESAYVSSLVGHSTPDAYMERLHNLPNFLAREKDTILDIKPIYQRQYYDIEEVQKFDSKKLNIKYIEKELRTGGALAKTWHNTGIAKIPKVIDEVLNLQSKGHFPVVIACWHKDIIFELYNQLKAKGFKVATIIGTTPEKDRKEIVNKFQQEKIDVCVIQLLAGGESITLTKAKAIVIAEITWEPNHVTQAISRVWRHGQPNAPIVVYVYANNSIDVVIREVLKRKWTTLTTNKKSSS